MVVLDGRSSRVSLGQRLHVCVGRAFFVSVTRTKTSWLCWTGVLRECHSDKDFMVVLDGRSS